MAVTKIFANTLLTNIFASAYIGLSSTKPATDGTGVTEPLESAGYKRVASSGGSFSATNGTITNTAYLYFPEATAAWGNISYLCVFDGNSSSAKLRYFGALKSPKNIEINAVPLFRPGSINITIPEGD